MRRRTPNAWNLPKTSSWSSNPLFPRSGTEMGVGGCEVAMSFIVSWLSSGLGLDVDIDIDVAIDKAIDIDIDIDACV